MPMMKKYVTNSLFVIALILCPGPGRLSAQPAITWPTPETEQMYNQARDYLSNGNLRQAIPVFQQLINLVPDQMVAYRDLGNAYYLSGNYTEADKTLTPVIESGKADEQCYHIAAASKNAQKEDKKARKILSKGLEKFPYSGLLYHQYGKLYDDVYDQSAALQKWVAGIGAAPNYRVNYYEAARTYYLSKKPVWAIIYGEIFINQEQLTPRSYETRKMLMAAYRKMFTTQTAGAVPVYNKNTQSKEPADFEEAVTQTLMKLAPVVNDGINTENLIMLRTRFMMEWQATYALKYPFTLFTFQESLLRAGHFDAYNQWLFGKVENAQQYEGWTKYHPAAIPDLQKWLSLHPLQPTATDHYNNGKIKGILPENPYKR
jgi:tetratricopeptide (TPR) repeat protein